MLKNTNKKFEKFIDKLHSSGIADLKVVENFAMEAPEEFEVSESEDTLSILNRFIEESEFTLDKSILKNIMRETYQEACEMI